jgi:hypothetical protein
MDFNTLRQVIISDERIEQDLFPGCFYHETGVAVVSKFHKYSLRFDV